MKYYYENFPGIGNVAVSRHAQKKMLDEDISEELFEYVLLNGNKTMEMFDVMNKEGRGIRIVILMKPTPFRGAVLVKTVFRLKAVKNSKKI